MSIGIITKITSNRWSVLDCVDTPPSLTINKKEIILNCNKNEYRPMFADYPDVVSVEEMAKMLSIGKVLAYRLIKDKNINAKRIGREYKIQKSTIVDYLNDMEVKNERKSTN